MNTPTPGERAVLSVLNEMVTDGATPTMSDIAREAGLSKPGVQGHLSALRLKGHILGPVQVGHWRLTPEGKKHLQRA